MRAKGTVLSTWLEWLRQGVTLPLADKLLGMAVSLGLYARELLIAIASYQDARFLYRGLVARLKQFGIDLSSRHMTRGIRGMPLCDVIRSRGLAGIELRIIIRYSDTGGGGKCRRRLIM